jgi:hypothetical protein
MTDLLCGLSRNNIYDFSREGWNPETDVRGFGSGMIKARLSDERRKQSSFCDIFETLKQHNFRIVSGVDLADVLAFVHWIEVIEQFRE